MSEYKADGSREKPWHGPGRAINSCYSAYCHKDLNNYPPEEATRLVNLRVGNDSGVNSWYLFCDVCLKRYDSTKYPSEPWPIKPYTGTQPISISEVFALICRDWINFTTGENKMIGIIFDAQVVVTENALTANGQYVPAKSTVVFSKRSVHASDLTNGKALVLAEAIAKGKVTVSANLTETIEVKVVQYS
jgi:hypothetical protein